MRAAGTWTGTGTGTGCDVIKPENRHEFVPLTLLMWLALNRREQCNIVADVNIDAARRVDKVEEALIFHNIYMCIYVYNWPI